MPEWFPGAGFKTFAREAKEQFNLAVNGPFMHVKQSLEVSQFLKLPSLSTPGLIFVGTSLMEVMRLLLRLVSIVRLNSRIKDSMKVLFDK